MPRVRKRTTERGISQELMERAVNLVIQEQRSIRSVAKDLDICHVSLSRYCKQQKESHKPGSTAVAPTTGYKPHTRVFNDDQELLLETYLKSAADLYYGLTTRDVRKLAFECARRYYLKMPSKWSEMELAGVDWLDGFMKRHRSLSIRCPEATSLARAMNFNKPNVSRFFDNLASVLDANAIEPQNIYNVDETGVTTVQAPGKIIATKGRKQVGAITSAERGTLVTVCFAVSATGNSVPPMFIFPRKIYKDFFVRDGPVGCIGAANGSGWMQELQFITFIEHFHKHVRPSKEDKVLLLLDNHDSHLSISVIDFCRDNGIVLLSFPPHCSHRLQPLDKSVYGPFKKAINNASDAWMKNHPGQRMTIYDIPGLVRVALPQAGTPANIAAGFRSTGISPFNRDIFTELDYAPASVTDVQPLSETTTEDHQDETDLAMHQVEGETVDLQDDSRQELLAVPSTSQAGQFSPDTVRPLQKAVRRPTSTRGRKGKQSAVLTSTPAKLALQEEKNKKKSKPVGLSKAKRNVNFNTSPSRNQFGNRKARNAKKKKCDETDSSDEENETFCLVCCETYANSRPHEKWVQCLGCQNWSHEECTSGDLQYYCQNCASDDSS